MESDYYPVEVLHYLNPHLIWVEVTKSPREADCNFQFEQIGVWGVLPLESTVDMVDECLRTRKADVWAPGVNSIMAQILQEVVEVGFRPTFIDRRSSIFDSNIHKYGEIILKTKDGSTRKLSQILVKTNLAYFDDCDFHRELSQFNLKTKLDTSQAEQIITALENYYKTDKNYKNYEQSIKNSAVIHYAARSFETALTEKNVQLHNKAVHNEIDIKKILLQKHNDFNLCKDADEESVDCDMPPYDPRDVSQTSTATKPTPTKESLSRKLEWAKQLAYMSPLSKDTTSILLDTKKKLLENATLRIDGNSTHTNSDLGFANNRAKVKVGVVNQRQEIPVKTNRTEQQDIAPAVTNLHYSGSEYEGSYAVKKRKAKVNKSPNNPVPDYDAATQKIIAFGPPEVDRTKLCYKVVDKHFIGTNEPDNKAKLEAMPDEPVKCEKDLIGMDSEVDFPIGNTDSLPEVRSFTPDSKTPVCKTNVTVTPTSKSLLSDTDSVKSPLANEVIGGTLREMIAKRKPVTPKLSTYVSSTPYKSPFSDTDSVKSIISNDGSNSRPKFNTSIIKKMNLYKKATASSSDTSTKDASSSSVDDLSPVVNSNEKVNYDSDNETTISCLAKRLNLDDLDPKTVPTTEEPKRIPHALLVANHVNPFKNIDKNIAKFVDKLVSPVLMVHSKQNRRIVPTYELRDVCFSPEIHITLRNMSVKHPKTLQSVSWPTILRGLGLFMVSPPGGGKTLGYTPAVCRLVGDFDASEIPDSLGPICVIVCATSASVATVAKQCKNFLGRGKKVLSCYPGVDEKAFMLTLLNGCDIFVCTPPCLVRMLKIQDFGLDLKRLSYCVLDDCERLNEVYVNEIKLFFQNIKDMLKNRANKVWKIQYIAASRIWCDIVEMMAMKAHNSVVAIGSFQECVLYSKSNMTINFVKNDNKKEAVLEFINNIDISKKTAIICHSDDEVDVVSAVLRNNRHVVISTNSTMTVEDLYSISCNWSEYGDPMLGPILVCCDDNLAHFNITDVHNLLHYSLPSLYSMFMRRFAILIDHYPSIFKDKNDTLSIKIFLDEDNVNQLPKILHFIKRCTDNVPSSLDDVCRKVLSDKDMLKAQSFVPICDNILSLGECPDFWNCKARHTLFKEFDEPQSWIPTSGIVEFRILHFHTAVTYSARLIANVVNGIRNNYAQNYTTLPLKMGMFFSLQSNRQLHGIPKVGDLCAVSIRPNFYERGRVVKILSRYEKTGNPHYVLITLIDEEKLERCRDIDLYHLPEKFRNVNCNVLQVRLVNVQPKDNDITFSDLAIDCLSKYINKNDEIYLRGNIVSAIGNTLLVDSLEACQDLSSMRQSVVRYNFKEELLNCHAIANNEHINKIKAICERDGVVTSSLAEAVTMVTTVVDKKNPTPRWAHLEEGDILVYFASAESPDKFFVRLEKYQDCLDLLTKDIQKYMAETQPPHVANLVSKDIVIAKFPDDSLYYRARIDERLAQNKAKCFFVDHGDWREVHIKDIFEMEAMFIIQMPFQAIECRMIGLKPPGVVWTEFSTNWFCDQCFVGTSNDLKKLYARYFTKEIAESTEGNKYGIVLIDTRTADVIINNQMLENNLACEDDEEICYLRELEFKRNEEVSSDSEEECVPILNQRQDIQAIHKEANIAVNDLFMKMPIRSMPLVNSDDEPDDWDLQMSVDTLKSIVKIGNPADNSETKPIVENNVPAIKTKEGSPCNDDRSNTSSKSSDFVEISTPRLQELDSDDLSNPEQTLSDSDASQKGVSELRKPKLFWHETQCHVFIRIELIGVDTYAMTIKERSIDFETLVHDTHYGFNLDLYGLVDPEKSTHDSKGLYIFVKLVKCLTKKWESLVRDELVRKWIAYDPDSLEASSDEDDTKENEEKVRKIIQAAHEAAASDSGDDGDYVLDDFQS